MKTYIKMYVVYYTLYTVCCEYVDNGLRRNFNTVVSINSLSSKCQQTLSLFSDRLNKTSIQDKDTWALEMLDATSKMPVGQLSYNFADFGHFKQCTEIESKRDHITGKYCLGYVIVDNHYSVDIRNQADLTFLKEKEILGFEEKVGYPIWTICLPSNCTDEDAMGVMTQKLGINIAFVICQTIDDVYPPLNTDAIVGISILSVLLFIVILSTLYDLCCQNDKNESGHPGLIAFSLYTNGKKLFFEVSKRSSPLSCLDGIRVISMIWITIYHTLYSYKEGLVFDTKQEVNLITPLLNKFIFSSHLACDSFLLVGGTLVTYMFFKKGKDGEITFSSVIKHYFHRYMRLAPPLAGVILIWATLLKYMGSGPKWAYLSNLEYCTKYWWSSLLFVHNEVNVDQMCTLYTWYLDVDMQLYILSPLIFWMLKKYTKIGIAVLVLSTLASIITLFVRTYEYELLSETLSKTHYPEDVNYDYFKTKTRAAPWLMGTILGYMLTRKQFTKVHVRKIIVVSTWIVSLAVMLLCIFGPYISFRDQYYNIRSALFAALFRPAFALAVGWIIWACATKHGGIINTMLSSSVFQFLNKFIYSMYIIHPLILFVIAFSQKTAISITILHVAYSFWGICMFSFGLSIIWVLVFENPIGNLEKIILGSTSNPSNNIPLPETMEI